LVGFGASIGAILLARYIQKSSRPGGSADASSDDKVETKKTRENSVAFVLPAEDPAKPKKRNSKERKAAFRRSESWSPESASHNREREMDEQALEFADQKLPGSIARLALMMPEEGEVSVDVNDLKNLLERNEALVTRLRTKQASSRAMILDQLARAGTTIDQQFIEYIGAEYGADERRKDLIQRSLHALRDFAHMNHHVDVNESLKARLMRSRMKIQRRQSSFEDLAQDGRVDMPESEADKTLLMDSLKGLVSWGFPVFQIEALTRHPLVHTGLQLIDTELYLVEDLHLDRVALCSFLLEMNSLYNNNSYHCALHGADVAQSMHYFLQKCHIAKGASRLEMFAATISALCHDVGHPGFTAPYLIASSNSLALTYNDASPLENMHCAILFKSFNSPDIHRADLRDEHYLEFRSVVIELILSTDNSLHGELMKLLASLPEMEEDSHYVVHKLKISLHAADVSNPAKDWSTYRRWTDRLMEEFYAQGDRERAEDRAVTPGFDRQNPVPMPNFQRGFIRGLVLPLYEGLAEVGGVDLEQPLKNLRSNLARWEDAISAQS